MKISKVKQNEPKLGLIHSNHLHIQKTTQHVSCPHRAATHLRLQHQESKSSDMHAC